MSRPARRLPALWVGAALAAILCWLLVRSTRMGSTGVHALGDSVRGALAALGLGEPLADRFLQITVELRLWRTLCAAGVGAALALSGAYLQGLFRNGLASPSVVGVNAGASLGAAVAIVLLGGYGPQALVQQGVGLAPILVTACAFVGALAVSVLVVAIASSGGRISVPRLLLVGIAINVFVSGMLAALQSLTLSDYRIARAIVSWTFGTLDDRSSTQVAMVAAGLAVSLAVAPFVARELDLYAGGEEDAQSLGVDVGRLKGLALVAAALAASTAVAVAGQIAFVGLVVPHMVRIATGASHRTLLPLSALGGAAFLLGTDLLQRHLLGDAKLQPGVVMSLVGGPFFLFLLWRARRELETW